MYKKAHGLAWVLLAGCFAAGATTLPRLTFEQLADSSEIVAAGRVVRTWTAWDPEHKYIWTHYLLSVTDTAKGPHSAAVEFAEPGGALDGMSLTVAGAAGYRVGEDVAVFLSRMPNGYLRTAGWTQGKLSIDKAGRLHASGAAAALEGGTLTDLKRKVALP